MKRTISFLVTLIFAFVLALGLVVNSASADTGAVVQFPAIVTSKQSNPRDNFREINVQEFIDRNQIKATNPKAVAAQLFSRLQEEEEGRRSEDISVKYPTMETAFIVYTIKGLPDDSTDSSRDRIELKSNQNKWEIVWVGSQSKCRRGSGNRDWSSSICP
ncbi:hypothetical protein [aff. Roholtiella sp. LEGE 12411]|uniref:hypothetical protein n=1 Tax=aff. Roholtiella sp. LEGE 12411 TaxID=1828822 RepID=UPI001880EEE8|nr:hypothetical protein [aff. Roholtiella sp. LEGE 12411]MBE9035842.1 hypothetical protein [aff. Roholtiella sp. LEGE 12411]